MGLSRDHAIIVTSADADALLAAHQASWHIAVRAFAEAMFAADLRRLIGPIIGPTANGCRSFFIAPDGSAENFAVSSDGDNFRAEFVRYLRSRRSLRWVVVQYGDGDDEACVIADSEAPVHSEPAVARSASE